MQLNAKVSLTPKLTGGEAVRVERDVSEVIGPGVPQIVPKSLACIETAPYKSITWRERLESEVIDPGVPQIVPKSLACIEIAPYKSITWRERPESEVIGPGVPKTVPKESRLHLMSFIQINKLGASFLRVS
jgi:hypothetical protein